MTRLLVSVRDLSEARIALDSGVDLIDVKEPARGSLGAAGIDVAREIIRAVDGRVPLSAALGELADARPDSGEFGKLAGLDFVKWGLAGCAHLPDWQERFARAASMLPPAVSPVAVAYADWRRAAAPSPAELLRHARRIGCGAALVDTYRKGDGDLFAYWSDRELDEFVGEVQEAGMLAVVGGSITVVTLSRVLECGPDFLAVRGAACKDSRTAGIDAERIAHLVAAMRAAGSVFRR